MGTKDGRGRTHSQLLLEALDLGLQRVHVLRLPLVGHVAGVGQLRQTVESLLQSLHVRQQLCDLEKKKKDAPQSDDGHMNLMIEIHREEDRGCDRINILWCNRSEVSKMKKKKTTKKTVATEVRKSFPDTRLQLLS